MTYSLKAVSGYLGVPADTVRKWEARHGLVRPKRLPNGYRVYSEEDLRRLLKFAEGRRAGLDGAQAADAAASEPAPHPRTADHKAALAAILRFDRPALARAYRRHAKALGFQSAFTEIWLAALAELGSRAHAAGGIWIAAEHFASAFLRESLLASFKSASRGRPRLVVAAPEGDRHELGMLAAACELEKRGVSCVYLGADLPVDSLAAAQARLKADAVSLTLTVLRPRKELRSMLAGLRRRFPALRLYICGQESLRHANLIRDSGAMFVGTDFARGIDRISRDLGGRAK